MIDWIEKPRHYSIVHILFGMLFFTILTYASVYASMAFAALCLATGLYYVAELAEEYSVLAKKLLEYSLFTIVGIHVLLGLFDPFPLRYIAI
ncbi:Transmembrane adaptor Erv26 [compost metagenome]